MLTESDFDSRRSDHQPNFWLSQGIRFPKFSALHAMFYTICYKGQSVCAIDAIMPQHTVVTGHLVKYIAEIYSGYVKVLNSQYLMQL